MNFQSPPSPPRKAYTTSPVIVAFSLGVLICLVVGVFLIYFCRCFVINFIDTRAFRRPTVNNLLRQIYSPNHTANAAAASPIPGINPALLQIFPTFPYSSVKEFQKNNNNNKSYSLECAICLFEFEEDSFLRLLTFCCHVFHQECIDLWLESHKTCPVCRSDLDSLSKEKHQDQNQTIITENNPDDDHHNDNEARINVREEEEGVSGEGDQEKRFSKSHSTGHSIVVIKDDDDADKKKYSKEDRYTLRLPEHVRMKLMRGQNNHTSKSCESYMEMTKNL
ncbi:hypothetical protein QN277_029135 [Acacia crassicarpa]|uniref:RING-type E3 ubiquitin transferase n=1 Tax=Acacia crassicarpa TaxID=499986 RepID=A0AAE1J4W5_9FABA|nr:hypothetical protein QN277_029135 [Acacia crassicarpa]